MFLRTGGKSFCFFVLFLKGKRISMQPKSPNSLFSFLVFFSTHSSWGLAPLDHDPPLTAHSWCRCYRRHLYHLHPTLAPIFSSKGNLLLPFFQLIGYLWICDLLGLENNYIEFILITWIECEFVNLRNCETYDGIDLGYMWLSIQCITVSEFSGDFLNCGDIYYEKSN